MTPLRPFGPCLLLAIALTATAEERPFVFEPEQINENFIEGPAWQEGETRLPARPDPAALLEIPTDVPDTRARYWLDPASLSLGDDGITRYLVVIELRRGARNLSYEGIRCGEGQYKVFGYATGERPLRAHSRPEWRDIEFDRSANVYRSYLYRDYLCDPHTVLPIEPRFVVDALRAGRKRTPPSQGLFFD